MGGTGHITEIHARSKEFLTSDSGCHQLRGETGHMQERIPAGTGVVRGGVERLAHPKRNIHEQHRQWPVWGRLPVLFWDILTKIN